MKTIVFYDDLCTVCNYWVNWIMDNDNKQIFHFVALESGFANDFSSHFNYKFPKETIVVWEERAGFFDKSDAVIFILQAIRPSSFQLKVLKLFPKLIRNIGYSTFSYFRRYINMRKCKIPSAVNKKRFITDRSLPDFLNM